MNKGSEKYSYLIGYNFGNLIYDGGFYTEEGKKQYLFTEYDKEMKKPLFTHVKTFKEFKEIIEAYNYPKNK